MARSPPHGGVKHLPRVHDRTAIAKRQFYTTFVIDGARGPSSNDESFFFVKTHVLSLSLSLFYICIYNSRKVVKKSNVNRTFARYFYAST